MHGVIGGTTLAVAKGRYGASLLLSGNVVRLMGGPHLFCPFFWKLPRVWMNENDKERLDEDTMEDFARATSRKLGLGL